MFRVIDSAINKPLTKQISGGSMWRGDQFQFVSIFSALHDASNEYNIDEYITIYMDYLSSAFFAFSVNSGTFIFEINRGPIEYVGRVAL